MNLILLLIFSIIIILLILILIKLNANNINEKDLEVNLGMKISTDIQRSYNELIRENHDDNIKLIGKFGMLEKSINEELNQKNKEQIESMHKHFTSQNEVVEKRLDKIGDKLNEELNQSFDKTNKTFNNILERLTKIDETQKKIDKLSTEIFDLQIVLTDKKSRGTFGEVQLNQILFSIFGEKNDKVFEIQKQMSNDKIVDVLLHAPYPMGDIPIDSKFPLENYQVMTDRKNPEMKRLEAGKLFKKDIKKHIDDIANKYIITNETNQAIMFLPSEAIFAEINAYHFDLIQIAQNKNVWLTSPTTLMAVLTTLQVVLIDAKKNKYAKEMQEEINKLGEEFNRYTKRWNSLNTHIDQVSKDVKEINTTTEKITKKFDSISKMDLELLEGKKGEE